MVDIEIELTVEEDALRILVTRTLADTNLLGLVFETKYAGDTATITVPTNNYDVAQEYADQVEDYLSSQEIDYHRVEVVL